MTTRKRQLREVFTPGGQPSVTYVSRDHLNLERRVKQAIAKGFSINVVTGATKSGKTVLCNHVLAQSSQSISIEGGQIRSEADFWAQIVHLLDLGRERTRMESGATTGNLNAGGKAGIPSVIEINASGGVGSTRTTQRLFGKSLAGVVARLCV